MLVFNIRYKMSRVGMGDGTDITCMRCRTLLPFCHCGEWTCEDCGEYDCTCICDICENRVDQCSCTACPQCEGPACHCGQWCDGCSHFVESCTCNNESKEAKESKETKESKEAKESKELKEAMCSNCEHSISRCLCTFCS